MSVLRRILAWLRKPQPIGSRQRHPDWPRESKAFKAIHTTCIACGTTRNIEVHHKFPVSKFPELEMDKRHWRSMCGRKANDCHRMIGHGGDYRLWNEDVDVDAAYVRKMLKRIRERS